MIVGGKWKDVVAAYFKLLTILTFENEDLSLLRCCTTSIGNNRRFS